MNVLADLSVCLRSLRKAPGFTIAAILVLALGIGANTAIFSIVNGVLLQPLPFQEPDRLVQLWHTPPQKSFPGMTTFALSAANYLDWEQQNHVFQSSAIYSFTQLRLTGSGDPQVLRGARVEPTFFHTLGINALLGRAVIPGDEDESKSHIVVLSWKLWQTQFGGDPAILGKNLELNGQAYTVVGIMPRSFSKPEWATFWTPLVWDPVERTVRGEHHFSAFARLKPGVSVQQAQAELSAIAARLAQQYPEDDAGWGAKVLPMQEYTVGDVRKPLLVLLAAVAFVLLIGCANVANLIFARTLDRRKEIAIRTALGASRAQILRQVLAEAVLLSVTGAALGLAVAHFGTRLVVNYFGSGLPRASNITVDAQVLAFTFLLGILAGIVSGAAPAWKLSKADPNEALKQGGRTDFTSSGKRTRNVLVMAEVALSLILLVAAGLMIRTLWNLREVDPGFQASHVLTMTLGVSPNDYSKPEQEVAFMNELLQKVRSLPGVQSAGVVDDLPLQGGSTQPIQIEGQPVVAMADQPEVAVRLTSPGYFSAMGVPMLRGRDFNGDDRAGALPVVIISQSMAHRFWPNEDAVGKRLTLTFFPAQVREVVGVVGDVKNTDLSSKEPETMVYWPAAQFYAPEKYGKFRGFGLSLVVRTSTDPASATPEIKNAIHRLSASMPVTDIRTMEDLLSESISPQRFSMLLLAAFGVLAVLLASIGIYSVLAYSVRRRMREIGLRMALGAHSTKIVGMVVREGMQPTLLGVAIGCAGALALGRALRSLVFGVQPTDLPTFVCVAALLVAVGVLASALPAYRASRVDPLETLRDE